MKVVVPYSGTHFTFQFRMSGFKMIKLIRYLFLGGCVSVIIILFLLVVYVLFCGYLEEQGLNYRGAEHKYFTAMKAGNGPEAVYWIEKTIDYAKKEKGGYYEKEYLGYAYELNGQNEEALRVYQELGKESMLLELDVPRVKYKLGQKKEAFQDYCRYANDCLEKYSEPLKGKRTYERSCALGAIRCGITMEQDGFYMRLSPFLEYKDFLDFMRMQSIGERGKNHAAAMELFRAIDKEINENHLRSATSDELNAMREQILAERKEKGIKW